MRSEVAARVAGLGPGGQPEHSIAPQEPQGPDPRLPLIVDGGEVAQARLGKERVDLLRRHGHVGYFTTVCSTNSRPNPSVKLVRSSVDRLATSLAISALKSSRESHVSSATPSYGATCPSGTRITRFTTYPVRCS